MLAAAVAAYGTGSVTYTAVGRPDDLDVPWTAHAAWLSFHLLCCAAVVLLVRRRMRALAASLALDGVTGALMLAALTAALFLGDVTTGAVSGFDQFSGVAYLSGDLLLVAVLVWTASLGGRGGARMWMAMRDAMRPDDPLDPEAVVADVRRRGARAPAGLRAPRRTARRDARDERPSTRTRTSPASSPRCRTSPTATGRRATAPRWPRSAGWRSTFRTRKRSCGRPCRSSPRRSGPRRQPRSRAPARTAPRRSRRRCAAAAPRRTTRSSSAVPGGFDTDEARFVRAAADVLASALDRADAEADTRRRALEDPLTGLPNRAFLIGHLQRELSATARGEGPLALMLLDVDRFKTVNDTLGQHAGDDLLRQAAARLVERVRGGDVVARLGDDEFVVACGRLDGEADAAALVQRVVDVFTEPFVVDGRELVLGTSVGVAVASGVETTPDALLRDADTAMYRATEWCGRRYGGARARGAGPRGPGARLRLRPRLVLRLGARRRRRRPPGARAAPPAAAPPAGLTAPPPRTSTRPRVGWRQTLGALRARPARPLRPPSLCPGGGTATG